MESCVRVFLVAPEKGIRNPWRELVEDADADRLVILARGATIGMRELVKAEDMVGNRHAAAARTIEKAFMLQ
jgi:hypothetical protein